MTNSKKTIIVDSTQLSKFLECPLAWKYEHRDNIILPSPEITKRDVAMNQGSYGHLLFEKFYKLRASKASFTDAMKAAITIEPGVDLKLTQEQVTLVRQKFAMSCTMHMANDFTPISDKHVEIGFTEPIYEDCEHLFVLEGKIDVFSSHMGQRMIIDHKFQTTARTLYAKSIQFRNYTMITDIPYMLINYVRLAVNPNNPYERQLLAFSSDERKWWKHQLCNIYWKILHMSEANHFDQNWNSCSGQFGYPCQYTKLCEERSDNVRNNLIQFTYKPKPEWKPWELV